jgi:Ca2+-binding RTX toxin-like protein
MVTVPGTEGDDRLSGTDAGHDVLLGWGGNDLLRGRDGNDHLEGGAGDDNLYGGPGADTILGGGGIDILNYGDSATGVSVNLTTGANHGGAEGDVILDSIEIIRGSLFDDSLTGDGNGTTLRGLAGDDSLHGLGGADRLDSGDGDDVLNGGAGADTIIGGGGIDTVSYADSVGGPTINLITGINTNGDAEGDILVGIEIIEGSRLYGARVTGDSGVNIFHGLGSLNGFDGLGGDDIAIGADYADYFYGGDGNDTLDGAGYIDGLHGGAGDDVLIGGAGNDYLYGEAGADRFVYTALADVDVVAEPTEQEKISDFSSAQGDRIDLSAIDADGDAANGDNAFHLVTGGFTGAGAELLLVPLGTGRISWQVKLDVDGDRHTDFVVSVFINAPLTAADFVL